LKIHENPPKRKPAFHARETATARQRTPEKGAERRQQVESDIRELLKNGEKCIISPTGGPSRFMGLRAKPSKRWSDSNKKVQSA
jgi:hypothetical protein